MCCVEMYCALGHGKLIIMSTVYIYVMYKTDSLENSPNNKNIVKWSCWALVVSTLLCMYSTAPH
jgi:hypothetical protein